MGIYDGLKFLKRQGVRVIITPLHAHGLLLHPVPNLGKPFFTILINQDLVLEERVKTVIHEVLHCGTPYNNYMGYDRYLFPGGYKALEDEIEKLTQKIYDCQPVLVNWVRKKLEEKDKK